MLADWRYRLILSLAAPSFRVGPPPLLTAAPRCLFGLSGPETVLSMRALPRNISASNFRATRCLSHTNAEPPLKSRYTCHEVALGKSGSQVAVRKFQAEAETGTAMHATLPCRHAALPTLRWSPFKAFKHIIKFQ